MSRNMDKNDDSTETATTALSTGTCARIATPWQETRRTTAYTRTRSHVTTTVEAVDAVDIEAAAQDAAAVAAAVAVDVEEEAVNMIVALEAVRTRLQKTNTFSQQKCLHRHHKRK